jgi:hypothetical protein
VSPDTTTLSSLATISATAADSGSGNNSFNKQLVSM